MAQVGEMPRNSESLIILPMKELLSVTKNLADKQLSQYQIVARLPCSITFGTVLAGQELPHMLWVTESSGRL